MVSLESLVSSTGAASSFLASSLASTGFLTGSATAGLAARKLELIRLWHLTGRSLTQFLELSLVALAGNDGLLFSLGLSGLGFQSNKPAVTLSSVSSLESMLLAVNLEDEFVGALLGKVGDIGLRHISVNNNLKSQHMRKKEQKNCLPN